jgi:Transglycosylase SLT domain
MRFCFRLVPLAVTTAVLAGTGLAASGPDGLQHMTSVVRADLRTGKLVRSLIVTSKPVSQQRVSQQRIAETVVRPRVVSDSVAVEPSTSVELRTDELRTGDTSDGINAAVDRIALQHQLPPQLIHSVIKVESNYNTYAVSSKGAQGLMQLIPATARRFGVANSFNPVENIQGGARYLKYLLDLYGGDYPLALAAYNAGEGAVARYGGVPPYAETLHYLLLVRKRLDEAQKAAAAKPQKAAAAKQKVQEVKDADAASAAPAHIVEVIQADGTVRYVAR